MSEKTLKPNSGRKLFFGLFIFPLLITVGMAILLCLVVLLTHEQETPETLIAAIKSGTPSKRWQKAFELSNELGHKKEGLRGESVETEILSILQDEVHYDPKTRAYMTLALSHFRNDQAIQGLQKALGDSNPEVRLYALWGLGALKAKGSLNAVTPFLTSDRDDLRQMSAYVVGIIGGRENSPSLLPLLDDTSADVRWNAALSLARLGDASGYNVLLEMLKRDALVSHYQMKDEAVETVMTNAIKGLALIRTQDSIRILEDLSRHDKSLKVRQAAISAMEYQKN